MSNRDKNNDSASDSSKDRSDDLERLGQIGVNNRGITSSMVSNSKFQINPLIKFFYITTSALLIVISAISMIRFLITGGFFLSFNFDSRDIPFQTHPASIFTTLILIITGLSINIYALVKENEDNYLTIFNQDANVLMIISNLMFVCPFLIGMTLEKKLFTAISSFICYICTIAPCVIVYRRIKLRRNFSRLSLTGLNIFTSVLMSLLTYLLVFSLMDMITIDLDHHSLDYATIKSNLSITADVVYAGVAVVCITTTKDIIYPILLFIIQIGYISKSSDDLVSGEIISALCVLSFIMIATVITVVKYKKVALGYEDSSELLHNLQNAHDMASNK